MPTRRLPEPKTVQIDFDGAEREMNIDKFKKYMDGSHNVTMTLSTVMEEDKKGKAKATERIEIWAQEKDGEGPSRKGTVKIASVYVKKEITVEGHNQYKELKAFVREVPSATFDLQITPPDKPKNYDTMPKDKKEKEDKKMATKNTGYKHDKDDKTKIIGHSATITMTFTPQNTEALEKALKEREAQAAARKEKEAEMNASQGMPPMHEFDMDDKAMLEQASEWERHMEESEWRSDEDFEHAA